MDYFQRHLQHLAEMARKPESRGQACWRALELDADTSGLFGGMSKALMREVPGLEKAMAYVGRELTKRR